MPHSNFQSIGIHTYIYICVDIYIYVYLFVQVFKYIHIQICIHARFGFLYISSTCFLSWGHSPETEEPAKEAAERSPQVVPPPAWMQKRKAVPCHDLKQICTFQVFFIHIYICFFLRFVYILHCFTCFFSVVNMR